jgi:hypothetical protein
MIFDRKKTDGLPNTVLEKFEIGLVKISNRIAVLVDYSNIQWDQRNSPAKDGRSLVLCGSHPTC